MARKVQYHCRNTIIKAIERFKFPFAKRCIFFAVNFVSKLEREFRDTKMKTTFSREDATFVNALADGIIIELQKLSKQTGKHFVLSQIEKYKKLLCHNQRFIVDIYKIFCDLFDKRTSYKAKNFNIKSYIKQVVIPAKTRLQNMIKENKKIWQTKLNRNVKGRYFWRCLLCNTYNDYNNCMNYCPTCVENNSKQAAT